MSKQRKAFTLVELLVVIAIIGILFVVLISKVDFATEKSKATGVQTDFRSYQVAIETVARENAGLSVLVDNDADGEAKYAELEKALNKNLDSKLHVEIDADGKISTEAKDPWKEQYLGTYLAPDTDGTVKDRGAIVMYCKGSNLKLGTTAVTENGVVNVTIESGKETEGADDYSISTIYTYVNGYGEIQTATTGFSNDIDVITSVSNATSSAPGGSDQDGDQGSGSVEPVYLAAGLYDADDNRIADWDALVNTYGMDIEKDYTFSTIETDTASPRNVLTNNADLAGGARIVIDDSVTAIGEKALVDCMSLTSIDIPASVTTIGDSAFAASPNLINVYYQGTLEQWCNFSFASAETNPLYAGANLYIGNELADDIVIPESVATLNSYAFFNCKSLTSVNIPANVTVIKGGAFFNCTTLTSVTFADGSQLTSIDDGYYAGACYHGTFSDCTSLESIEIPASVTNIGDYAFSGCTSLTGLTFAEGSQLTSVGFGVFHRCTSLKNVEISASVTDIGTYVFSDCTSLTNVTFEEGSQLTTIGEQAFCRCTNLESIEMPASMTTIGDYTFEGCISLESIEIPAGVTTIGAGVFDACTSLATVIFEGNGQLVSIGAGIFRDCTSLASIEIPASLTHIGAWAFDGCTNLTSVTFERNSQLTSINAGAFRDCTSLASIEIPAGITSIDNYIFKNCTSLSSIAFPASVTTIGTDAFYACKGLTSVTFAEGSQLTAIGKNAFYWCTSLTSIAIPANVTSIGEAAFYNCESLASVIFAESSQLNTIGKSVFCFCKCLTSIELPAGVTSIGEKLFYACMGLASVTIHSTTMVAFQTSMFDQCGEMKAIYVPAELVDSYKAASGWSDFADKIQAIV